MGRPLRPDVHGAWYHVINRGADRQDIFSCDADFVRFERLMGEAVDEFGIEVHAYSMMDNHFHWLVHCPSGGLSTSLKSVQAQYASTYNHIHGRTGPLFERRFTSVSVDDAGHRHLAGRYIHRNPLDIVPAAALVNYRWSSFGAYAGRRNTPSWLSTAELDAQFCDPQTYVEYVLTRQISDTQAERVAIGAPIGALATLDAKVASLCEVAPTSLFQGGRRRRNDPRLLAIMLAVELRLADTATIASRYGLSSAAAVRATARRGRVRCESDPSFATLRYRLLEPRAA